jgi:hypothetical protein
VELYLHSPSTPSWRGDQLKKAQWQLYLYLLLNEKCRLVCENKVLRRIFRPRREEEAGGWRRLHNEELHNLYGSPILLERCAGHVECMCEFRNAYDILVGKPEGKIIFIRAKRRWKDNIKMYLGEIR